METGDQTNPRIAHSFIHAKACVNRLRSLGFRLLPVLAISIALGCLLDACGGGSSTTTSQPQATTLTAITVDPVDSSIAAGTTLQLHATASFSDGTTEDFTDSVTWTSANITVATVDNAPGAKGFATAGSVGSTTISATHGGKTGVTVFSVTKAALTSITIEPVNPVVAKGTMVQLAAVGNFSDGSTQDLTTQVSWTSGNSLIAPVSSAKATLGLVTGLGIGSTPITASLAGIQGSATVTVTAPTLTSLTVLDPAIAKGTQVQLTAAGSFSDGTTEDLTSQLSWTSDNSKIAQVSDGVPTKGLVTGLGIGSSSINATLGAIRDDITVSVTAAKLTSLTITPPDPSLAKGTTLRAIASGTFSDGTTEDLTSQVSWTSNNNSIAQVSDVSATKGLVTGLGVGSTPITATFESLHGSTAVSVTSATLTSLTLTPPNPSIADGTTVHLTATGNFSDGTTQNLTSQVSWTSDNSSIAQASDEPATKGLVTGTGPGSIRITGTLNGIHGFTTVTVTSATLVSLTITPPSPSVANGTNAQLRASGIFSDQSSEDLTSQVSWTSGNNAIARVSNEPPTQGLVAGSAVGNTSIMVTLNGIHASITMAVTKATLADITITSPTPSIAKGIAEQLVATCDFSDATTQDCSGQVSWTSGDDSIAEVSNAFGSKGRVTGLAVGNTSIAATLNGIHASTTLTVTEASLIAIAITPPAPSIAKGTPVHLAATCDLSDGTVEDCTSQVSWTSGDNTIAEVSDALDAEGIVTGLGVGTTSIFATLEGTQGSATITVTAAVLTSLLVTPPDPSDPSVASGTSLQMTATGVFSDGTTEDLTEQAEFSSSDPSVLVADDVLLINGLMVAVGPGSATITADFGGILGSTQVTVTAPTLTAITVDPVNFSIAKGTTQQLMATGDYTDGTTEDLTGQVSWTSSNNAIAQVSNVTDTEGLVTGLGVGSTSIAATLNGMQGLATVSVTPPVLTSLSIGLPVPSIAKGTTVKVTVTGNFSDGSTQDVTSQVSWTSGNNAIEEISDVLMTKGLITGLSVGSTTIIATLNGIQSSVTLSVTPPVLTSLGVTIAASSIDKGTTVQAQVIGSFSDGSTQDLISQVSWTSANNTIAQVSNAVTSEGLVSGLGVGNTSITATLNGVQGSAPIAVTGATLASIVVTPANPTVSANTNKFPMTATGFFTDGSQQDLTQEVNWISSNTKVAHILSTKSDVSGRLNAQKPGTTVITATLGSVQGSTVVTVTP